MVEEKALEEVEKVFDTAIDDIEKGAKDLANTLLEPFTEAGKDLAQILQAKREEDVATTPEELTESINDVLQTPYRIVREVLEEVPIFKGIYTGLDDLDKKYWSRSEKACNKNNEVSLELPNIFGKPESSICLSTDSLQKVIDNPDKGIDVLTSCVVELAVADTVNKIKDMISPYQKRVAQAKGLEIGWALMNAFAESLTNFMIGGVYYIQHPLEIGNQFGGCLEQKLLE